MTPRQGAAAALLLFCGCVPGGVPGPGAPVLIAVVDDGVDLSHPGLRDHLAGNRNEVPDNGVDDDGNGFVDDARGYDFLDWNHLATPCPGSGDPSHGTMVALVALEASGARPITILPLRVADDSVVDGGAAGEAISYAAGRAVRVIVNLSLGTIRSSLPQALVAAITRQPQVLFVVAAGNQGRRVSEMRASLCRIPADNLVCVAAVDDHHQLAGFPKATNFGAFVDLAAPGVNVAVRASTGILQRVTGSSVAAATVSGAAARLWSAAPDANARDLARALCAGARREGLGDAVECGILDVDRSLQWIRGRPRNLQALQR